MSDRPTPTEELPGGTRSRIPLLYRDNGDPGPFFIVQDHEGNPRAPRVDTEPAAVMRMMVRQTRAAAEAGLHYPALITALAVPDICGALSSENGRATGSKARAWIVQYLGRTEFEASLMWEFRCSMEHQARTTTKQGFRLGFSTGGDLRMHWVAMKHRDAQHQMVWIVLEQFIDELATAVEAWLADVGTTTRVRRNLEACARERPGGYLPFILGANVFA